MFIGVIADDLTSAADGGAPFARAGHSVFVRFQDSSALLTRDADVVAMDLDSRARPEAEAAALAAAAGSRFQNAALLLKTMDSTLRGMWAPWSRQSCVRQAGAPRSSCRPFLRQAGPRWAACNAWTECPSIAPASPTTPVIP